MPRSPTPHVERVFVALGSNLGDRAAHLAYARERLGRIPETRVLAASRVEETAPLGPVPQGPFLNQMVVLETGLPPRDLLLSLLEIERERGRERGERWGPRTLDLDIVRYGDWVVAEAGLTIPHPELANREFWRRELAELEALVAARV
jgi:2-amino-4-hydroxy-6-hydroxymethyldihydropteridine diphosphokinase